ncbi:MAG: peptidoglycan DD-metalloendopeptidase family protein [Oscillospiraceae bacterium]|nr:peptidoglycan DD-metalloendopeptidase family protein [Oscillospiraceae bacterium]
MSKKTIRVICILLAALMLFGIVAMIVPAYAVTQSEIDALERERDSIKAQQSDIRDQIETLQAERASVMQRKAALDQQIELNWRDIQLIDEQVKLYDGLIRDQSAVVAAAVESENTQFDHYRTRVRAMEESNTWTYVSILLQATSLTDFLARFNDVADILRNDKNLRAEYVAAREAAEKAQGELEAYQTEQEIKLDELQGERDELNRQLDQAGNLILMLEDDIDTYEMAMEEKDAMRDEIQARIDEMVVALQEQEEAERRAREAYEAAQREAQRRAEEERRRQEEEERQRREEEERRRQEEEALQQQQQQQGQAGAEAAAPEPDPAPAPTPEPTPEPIPVASDAGYYIWPSSATFITSKHGYRVHPIFGTTKYHAGVDIGAGYGDPISAAAGGTVQVSEYSDSYGYYCVIYHSNGTTSLYAHMNSMPVVAVGDTVSAGDLIGYVGATGWATGAHLHFEIRVNGTTVDPLGYFPGIGFTFASDA